MIEMYIYSHCLQVAITTPEGGSWSYPHIKISHPDQERLAIPPGCTFPILFERWGGFFYVPQEPDQERFPKRGPKAQALWGEGGKQAPPGTGQMSTWKVFFIIKNIFIMKKLTDFRKRWKPVWIRSGRWVKALWDRTGLRFFIFIRED